jgi:single-strand DNA-binding protein
MQVIVIAGTLGADAEVKAVNGREVLNFSVACENSYKNKQGEIVKETTWYRCSVWGDPGKLQGRANVLKKGATVSVWGDKISARPYTTQGGELKAELNLSVREIKIQKFVDSNQAAAPAAGTVPATNEAPEFDDLPF